MIFDLDGTILDTRELYFKATEIIFPDRPKEFGIIIGQHLEKHGREQLLINLKMKGIEFDNWLETWIEEEKEIAKPFNEIYELLSIIRNQNMSCVINTNRFQPPEFVIKVLQKHDLHEYFSLIETSLSVGAKKPDPRGLNKIIKILNIQKAEAIYIGDSISDVLSGRRAEIKTLAVTTGIFNKSELVEYNPYSIIDSLVEVTNYI